MCGVKRSARWLIASPVDLSSGKVVGWAMDDSLESDLVERAIRMAVQTRSPQIQLLHHSDHGSQYAASSY